MMWVAHSCPRTARASVSSMITAPVIRLSVAASTAAVMRGGAVMCMCCQA